MRAAIVAVGSELLGTSRLDTNSLAVTELLRRHGVDLVVKLVASDREADLRSALEFAAGQAEVVVVSGGLGPTADDVTRQAVAALLGRELREDRAVVEDIRAKFRSFGRDMPEVNRRQAQVPDGAEVLPNARGTAPGLGLDGGGTTFFLLPGVPRELVGLLASSVEPWLAARSGGAELETRVVRIAGLPESEVEERLAPAYEELGTEAIGVFAHPGDIRVEVHATGPAGEREAALSQMVARVAELVGEAAYAIGEDLPLEEVVSRLLRERGETLATAESCTGGLLAGRVTSRPGSSDVFRGGFVAYADDAKARLVGVTAESLASHGAVSEPVARELATGARRAYGSTWGIGVTGVAGPGGGSEAKPVGTVHVAVAGPDGGTHHRRLQLPGDRQRVRDLSVQLALEMLRRAILARGVREAAAPAGETR